MTFYIQLRSEMYKIEFCSATYVCVWVFITGTRRQIPSTVNSLYSGHCRDLKLVSSVARVRNSGSLFQMSVIYFCPEFICCPYYRGVRYSGVSARRELTVFLSFLLAFLCLWAVWAYCAFILVAGALHLKPFIWEVVIHFPWLFKNWL